MPHSRVVFVAVLALALAGCAATGESGRQRMVAPQGVGAVYSEFEVQAQLAVASDATCAEGACATRAAFQRQVARLGTALSHAAYREFPQLRRRIYNFYFQTPAKSDIGILSSALGTIVVLDGVRSLEADDGTLAYLLAREMGHVIAEHHEENSATSLLVSAAVTLALPVANLLRGAAATAPAAMGTGTATAVSVAGGRALRSMYRPDQVQEADAIAMRLVLQAGYEPEDVVAGLAKLAPRLKRDGWMGELLVSNDYLLAGLAGPPVPPAVPPDLGGLALETSLAQPPISSPAPDPR